MRQVQEREVASLASAVHVTRAAYAAIDAAVAEAAATQPVEILLQQDFGVLRNAFSLLLALADERDAAQQEAAAAEAARDASVAAAREAIFRDALANGLPEAAAVAAAAIVDEPTTWLSTISSGRSAWVALGKWARTHGVGTEATLRWVLGALELPVDAAPSVLSLLDEEGHDAVETGSDFGGSPSRGHAAATFAADSPSLRGRTHVGGGDDAVPTGWEAASPADRIDPETRARLEQAAARVDQVRLSDAHDFINASSDMFNGLLECIAARGPVAAVAVGPTSSFATSYDGGALCWGRGDLGELGLDDPDELADCADGSLVSHVPRRPSGLGGVQVTQLSAAMHVLAVGSHGELFAWGCAARGVLGLGPPASLAHLPEYDEGVRFQPYPARVRSYHGAFRAVSAAEAHSLAVTADGVTLAWGSCDGGKLGVPAGGRMYNALGVYVPATEGCAWEPIVVSGLDAIRSIRAVSAARDHSMAVSVEGRLYSWGDARHGKLGIGPTAVHGPTAYQSEPRMVHALREWHVLACAAGEAHAIAICAPRSPAVAAAAISAATVEGGGERHVDLAVRGALATAGAACSLPSGTPTSVFVWGLASCGRLGLPLPTASTERWSPPGRHCVWSDGVGTSPMSEGRIAGGSSGGSSSGGSSSGGGFGSGGGGHPFSFDDTDGEPYVATPQRLAALDHESITHVTAGSAHTFATSASGEVYGWGLATHGRLGVGREDTLPTDADGEIFVEWPMGLLGLKGYKVSAVAAGESHAVACTVDGQLLSWGAAAHGKLGFEEGGVLQLPVEVDGEAYQPLPRQIWVPEAVLSGSGGELLQKL